MARSPTTLDAFAAIAEPKRRRILETLGGRRMPVTQLVDGLHWPQPMVSKHLAVLRQVGLLRVERRSRQKVYEVNAAQLKSIHDWSRQFEQLWSSHLHSIKARAEAKARAAAHSNQKNTQHKEHSS